jgi:hypothetical protein
MDIFPNDIQMLIYKNLHKSYLHDVHFQMSKLLYFTSIKYCVDTINNYFQSILWRMYKKYYPLHNDIYLVNHLYGKYEWEDNYEEKANINIKSLYLELVHEMTLIRELNL